MNELMWACAILPEKEETAIKSICKRLNKGVGLPETVFRFPLHISLKKSWYCDRFEAAQTDVADYLKHCGSFDIEISKPIMHKNMIWLPVGVTGELQEIHKGLNLLLERKYGVPRATFDASFQPHISLFTKGDHGDMAAMHELLVKETMPQIARIRNIVIGGAVHRDTYYMI